MILHFIIDKKHGESFIKYINNNFDFSEHFFILIGSKIFNIPEGTNSLCISKKNFFLKLFTVLHLMSKADTIIVHYLAFVELYFFLTFGKIYLKKIKWIMFGGDIYEEYSFLQRKLLRKFFCKIDGVCYLIDEDYEYICAKYNVEPSKFKINYAFTNPESYIKMLKSGLLSCNKDDFSVIVGNSATQDNNHEEMFEYLKNKKELQIFCPLSYGDMSYAYKIIELGKEKFGSKFHPITEFIPYEQYLKKLCKISFGVYGYRRQQGLGNVRPMLLMGKKVFLIQDSPIYKHFKRFFPNQVYSISDIDRFDKSQLIKTEGIQEDFIRDLYNVEKNKALWNVVFTTKKCTRH